MFLTEKEICGRVDKKNFACNYSPARLKGNFWEYTRSILDGIGGAFLCLRMRELFLYGLDAGSGLLG